MTIFLYVGPTFYIVMHLKIVHFCVGQNRKHREQKKFLKEIPPRHGGCRCRDFWSEGQEGQFEEFDIRQDDGTGRIQSFTK